MEYKNISNGKVALVPWYKDEAIASNVSRYVTDEKCPECSSEPIARYTESDECVQCASIQAREDWRLWKMGMPGRPEPFTTTKEEAIKAGVNYYYINTLCNGGNHFIKRNIKTMKCMECVDKAKPPKVESAINKFMNKNPDMVIAKESASALGMSVFRTGQPCRRGHKFWRYVNGGACIACMRPNSYPAVMKMRDNTVPPLSIQDQMSLFIGYAWYNGKMLSSDGRRLNSTQFDAMFDLYRFSLRNGGFTFSATAAFKENFV